MASHIASGDPKTRQACEPCRRKKTKHQRIVDVDAGRVTKSSDSSIKRVRNLESKVGQIYDILQSLTNLGDDGKTLQSSRSSPDRDLRRNSSASGSIIVSPSPNFVSSPISQNNVWSPANPNPPAEVIDCILGIYETKIYFQPLPLFKASGASQENFRLP
ncbi:hypothetical protein HYQ46_012574 [Verticillium longisporum]|nr:hypothetical protein HYQ44_010407 [Verticillium longisporum]KAG7151630.1 hypothetical protein HYQ46_012574 [Verticillium longisporum]